MTNTDTRDWRATVSQIKRLEEAGCEIVRVAVLDEEAVEQLPEPSRRPFGFHLLPISISIIVWRWGRCERESTGCGSTPATSAERIRCARWRPRRERQVPDPHWGQQRFPGKGAAGPSTAVQLPKQWWKAPCATFRLLEDHDFDLIKVSLKSSDVLDTIAAYRLLASQMDYPLHLGITEAGTLVDGAIKSALGHRHSRSSKESETRSGFSHPRPGR